MDSRSEKGSTQERNLIHFNIIETHVCKTLTRLCQENYAKQRLGFAKKQSLVTVLHTNFWIILDKYVCRYTPQNN